MNPKAQDIDFMQKALRLAKRGYGLTSPNPMVGVLIVKKGQIIGQGWHRRAGLPHAEVEALLDAKRRGQSARGAQLFVTLEPCSTQGRTGPCCDAILDAGIKTVFCGATDPNPRHRGRGFRRLRQAGIRVVQGVLQDECTELNEAFNHWITQAKPFVTLKAAMTLDGKIATSGGQSQWITGEQSRRRSMSMRFGCDGILVGIETVLHDDPQLTVRLPRRNKNIPFHRIILDTNARMPLDAKVLQDQELHPTIVVVGERASSRRVRALEKTVTVWRRPLNCEGRIDLNGLMPELGKVPITHLLVEGGSEVNASILSGRFADKVCFFYAPKVLGGRGSLSAFTGSDPQSLNQSVVVEHIRWEKVGSDLLLTGYPVYPMDEVETKP